MSGLEELTLEEIEANFELLGDWEQRFSYVLDLGRKLPELPDSARVEENRVRGCQSTVWLKEEVVNGDGTRIVLLADSDAHIVKGLIAILLVVSHRSRAEARDWPPSESGMFQITPASRQSRQHRSAGLQDGPRIHSPSQAMGSPAVLPVQGGHAVNGPCRVRWPVWRVAAPRRPSPPSGRPKGEAPPTLREAGATVFPTYLRE